MNYLELKSKEEAFQKIRHEWLLSVDKTIRYGKFICILSAIALVVSFLLFGCSKPESNNCNCEGQFVNIETAEYIHQPTDCDRTPPDGYVFVKCLDEPEY